MMRAPTLPNESERLLALEQYDLTASDIELGLGTVMTLARSLFQVPTGYASLSMLRRYPLTKLKIDRSFTTDLDGGEIGGAIVNAIISMARSLSLEVIAEGVETRWQADLLRAAGCNLAQGYLYGAPVDPDAFERTHASVEVDLAA